MSENSSIEGIRRAALRGEPERALRDGRSLLAAVLENLPLGVGVYDRDGNLTLSNERLRNYGYLDRLPSRQPAGTRRWRGFDTNGKLIAPADYPGLRALRGEYVVPGIDFFHNPGNAPECWMRISAVPFRREGNETGEAILVVQDVDDLKRAGDEQYECRVIRPEDGGVRWLRDTSFPIRDDHGAITRIGGIAEDLTQQDSRQVYIVSHRASEARRLSRLTRALDYRARIFESASAFLDIAPVLAPGCVLVDLRKGRGEGLSLARELKARSIALPAVAVDDLGAGAEAAVAAMKAGAVDYVMLGEEAVLRDRLGAALAECHATVRPASRDQEASAHIARLTPREREVLVGLVDGGTNKLIAQALGISPRTVELHRAQVMNKLGASSLTELVQVALAAGVSPSGASAKARKSS